MMANSSDNQTLINEAIKRILLDIVIRGHGERLIGRWSREPTIQAFLESVPYLLDRINQLHLLCMRSGAASSDTAERRQHVHSHHHHHHHHHRNAQWKQKADEEQACLHDLINLIGTDQHWLVRTRDSLGLTPLHKAVLFNNRPIVEFILDRYPDELAAANAGQSKLNIGQGGGEQRHQRLIDAQDKYGRTALHYAAALVSARHHCAQDSTRERNSYELENEHSKELSVFKFLSEKGANRRLRDFRGKTADFYARHPDQLRVKSIIHLANKLNANYQAVVLSRTLKALSLRGQRIEGEDYMQEEEPQMQHEEGGRDSFEPPSENRESMSISCLDLRAEQSHFATSTKAKSRSTANLHSGEPHEADQFELLTGPLLVNGASPSEDFQLSASKRQDSGGDHTNELARLQADRVERPVLDERTMRRVKRCLSEGKLEAINELVIDGWARLVLEEARISCWNAACKRYIAQVIPTLLRQLDSLHELVATNQLLALKELVTGQPILARIKRPYKRASMNALHLAAQWNRKSIVNFLIERLPELASETDSNGATCLHWAARSLHSDRLYNWLAEHSGAQLEQVRDRRGKTAANYRQQAIRLASFECQPVGESRSQAANNWRTRQHQRRDSQSDVERILDQTQIQAAQLQANGVRSQLMRRAAAYKSRPARELESHRVRVQPSIATPAPPIKPADKRDESAQVSIGIESASSIELDEEKKKKEEEEEEEASREGLNCERQGSASSGANSPNTRPTYRDEKATVEKSDEELVRAARKQAANVSDATDLFDEFGQLEAPDLVGGTVFQAGTGCANGASRPLEERATKITRASANDDGELRSPSSPGSANSRTDLPASDSYQPMAVDNRREHLATARDKNLNQIIGDCMAAGQFKKLEHLILAGCGQRVQQVYESTRTANESGAPLSREMGAFLEGRAIEFMQICQQIHHQIHQCHSQLLLHSQPLARRQSGPLGELSERERERALAQWVVEPNSALSTTQQEFDEATPLTCETLNANFHKLSSLLQDNAFLMARDKFGASPLHVALIRSDGRLIDYLLRRQPNVASAPDHDNRTAIHYAAIVLASFNRHGSFKVTNGRARAYWQVDGTTRRVYEDLCGRFGDELGALRDRKAKTGRDYLSQKVDEMDHIPLDKLSSGLYKPQLVAPCCPEYAQMLQRYDYLILVAGEQQDEMPKQVSGAKQESHSEPSTQVQSPLVRVRQQHSSFEYSRPQRCAQSWKKDDNGSTSSEPPTSKPTNKSSTSSTLEGVRNQEELVVAGSPTMPARRQVAPKPVVGGCEPSFGAIAPASGVEHAIAKGPVRGEIATKKSLALAQKHQQTQAKRLNHSPRASPRKEPAARFSLNSPIVPVSMGNLGLNQFSSPIDEQHRRSKSKHARHHKKSAHSGRRNNPSRLSVVGGVIVPTIIHNDKMDEIETYDIIYRQTPSKCGSQSSSSSTGSFSGSNTSLNSSLLTLDELDTRHAATSSKHLLPTRAGKLSKSPSAGSSRSAISSISGLAGRHNPKKSGKFGNLNGELGADGGLASPAPLAAGPEDSEQEEEEEEEEFEVNEDEREEDDRVERLSNEFEDRVRREKSELRQKVDQIMREIKSSAKSGKSSRFLASPNDLSALNKLPVEAATQQLALSNCGRQQGSLKGAFDKKSITSSGDSKRSTNGSASFSSSVTCSNSQCNLSSSLSLNLSTGNPHDRTSSCSSSSSAGSTISSVSSPTTSIGGGREKPPTGKTVTIKEPNCAAQVPAATIVSQIVPIPSSAGPLSKHLSELTDQMVSKNSYGQTYLHFIASKSQSSSTLYKVLEHAKHLIGERDFFYRTARDVAHQFNLTTNVQVLDKFVIDLFIGGQTQLLWMLLNQGYSPLIHVSDPDGNDIMLILKLLKQERIISYLLQMADFQRWRDELHTFIRHGYSAGVSELIKKHKDLVRAKSAYSRTSLHLAVLFDRLEMIGELIAMDPACVQAVDNMGRTPLHYVYGLHLKNGEEIRGQLIAHGASVERRDVRERTAKYYYIFRREIEDIRRIELELN